MTPPGQLPRRQPQVPQGDAQWFVDDDDGYDRWRRQHQGGFVLNCEREPNARYLTLHRASCPTISGVPTRGDNWTTTYTKVCASTVIDIDTWAQAKTGARPDRCGTCQP